MFKRILLSAIVLSIFVIHLNAQSWSALGSGTSGAVYAMAEYNGELYVAGTFTSAGGIPANRIARWNGVSWDSLGSGLNSTVWSLCVYNGELYAGGYFNHAGGIYSPLVARWNGTSWNTAGSGFIFNSVRAMTVYHGKLFAGGVFLAADGVPANNIAQWNGTNWDSVGGGVGGAHPAIDALTVYNDKLIAGGTFTTAGGQTASLVASWNDTAWSSLGPSFASGLNGYGVYALQEFHSELYAGGAFDTIGNNFIANNMAVWNDTTWSEFGLNNYSYTYCFLTDSSGLYAGDYGLPGNHIGMWNDINWSPLGAGTSNNVIAMTKYNGELYVGGQFTQIGTLGANHVAKWGTPASVNENFDNGNISIYPNPSSEFVHVKLNNITESKTIFTLTDLTGRIVLTKETNPTQNNSSIDLDISELSNGIYMLSVKNGERLFTEKLIKE